MRQIATLSLIFGLAINMIAQASVAILGTGDEITAGSNSTESHGLSANFELRQGKIIVKASINEKEGFFLLDTGAESLIINGIPASNDNFEVQGITETSYAEPMLVGKMTWEDQVFEEVNAFKVDLETLERSIGIELAGIIGHSILGQGALYIDYKKELVTFLPSPKPRHLKKQGWQAHHLYQMDHLLAIGIKVNGQKLFMGLDTGAEINLIAAKSDLTIHTDKFRNVFGIGGEMKQAKQVQLETVQIGKSQIEIGNLYYYPCSSFSARFDEELKGLLGFPFFANNAFILDLANHVLYLKQN